MYLIVGNYTYIYIYTHPSPTPGPQDEGAEGGTAAESSAEGEAGEAGEAASDAGGRWKGKRRNKTWEMWDKECGIRNISFFLWG